VNLLKKTKFKKLSFVSNKGGSISFNENMNVFVGDHGCGKTTLLEYIIYNFEESPDMLGIDEFGIELGNAVVKDLNLIVDSKRFGEFRFNEESVCFSFRQNGTTNDIDENYFSDGFQKLLSFVYTINHAIFLESKCLIIDDFCEGLGADFSRALTELLIRKCKNMQVFVATNNRYAINKFDLRDLIPIDRNGNESKVYSYKDNQKVCDDFEYCGLNNSDYCTSRFFVTGWEEYVKDVK